MGTSPSISVSRSATLHGDSGPVVVLVHGSMDRRAAWARVSRRLGDGWRIVTYDRRGYSRAADDPGPFDVAHNVADLVAVIERFADDPVLVVGHSFGGVVALACSARRPDLIRAAAVYEPPQSWNDWWPGNTGGAVAVARADRPEDAAEAFMRRVVGDAVWEGLPERTKSARRAEGRALVGELTDIRRARPFDASQIPHRVLVARGERASQHQVRGTSELAGSLGTSPVIIAGAGHNAHASHPTEFANLVIQPLRET